MSVGYPFLGAYGPFVFLYVMNLYLGLLIVLLSGRLIWGHNDDPTSPELPRNMKRTKTAEAMFLSHFSPNVLKLYRILLHF